MDPEISIISTEKTEDGWECIVEVKGNDAQTQHTVLVSRDFLERFSFDGPEEMVRASFRFFLEREPKEEILPMFDLSEISQHFPEYEKQIELYV